MKNYSHNIQSLRGIAVLAVIFFHLIGVQIKYGGDYALPGAMQLGAIGVDIFFLISGFLMMTVTRSFLPGTKSMRRFVLHRCIRIYPLYWLVSSPIIALILIGSPSVFAALHINPDVLKNIPTAPHYLLKSLLLLPQENLPPLTVSWTLIHEMYFYCVFGMLLLFPSRLHILLLAIWSVVTLTLWQYLQPTQAQAWSYLLLNPLTLEFTTGCFIAVLLQNRKIAFPAFFLFIGVIATLVSWQLWITNNGYEFPIAGDRVAYFLLPCALILIGAVSLEYQQGRIFYSWLQEIGDASYSLYLTHILFLSIGGKVWQLYGDKTSLIDNLLWWPALFAITLINGILCYRWIEKPLLDFLRNRTKTA